MDRREAEAVLAALRKVRNAAIKMDRDPGNDPYTWGYGGREICRMLTAAVQEARAAVAAEGNDDGATD